MINLEKKSFIIEISNQAIQNSGLNNAIKDGFFTIWTNDRIKKAFKAGKGTMADFRRYKKDNSPRFCKIITISENELLNLFPDLYDYIEH